MLAAERRDVLLARLEQDGKVVAKDVATELGISEDSIRRDLRDLASAGLCQRVYGGALPVSPAIADHTVRTGIEVSGKHRVAAAAAVLIRPGSTAILDGGTTALAVAQALPTDLRATVITHSPVVAAALGDHAQVDVIVIGGRLFKHSMVTCGAAAVEAVNGIHADVFLLGVTGVHRDAGLTTGDSDEAAMKRTLAPSRRRHLRPRQLREDRHRVAVHRPPPRRHRRPGHRRTGGPSDRPAPPRPRRVDRPRTGRAAHREGVVLAITR